MRFKHMFQVTSFPLSLAQPMTSVLAHQAQVYSLSKLAPSKIARMLFDASDLTCFERRQLESQKRIYNPSGVKRTYSGFHRWAQKRILRLGDEKAREVIGEALGIDDLDGLAELMVALNEHDAELVRLLLSGRLGEAIRRVPSAGYGAEGAFDRFSYGDVMDLIDMIARLWIANDLQMEAAAAHVRLFRPTGCEVMDGVFNGAVPKQGSVAVRLNPDLALFEAAARLYFEDLCLEVPESFGTSKLEAQRVTIKAPSATLVVSLPTDPLLPFRRDAAEAEAALFRAPGLDLEQRARIMLVYWRAEHGDQLEAWLEARMRQARVAMRELRTELDHIRKDGSRRNQHAHKLKGAHPLVRLWLACERAVAWTGPADTGERANDRALPQPLDMAIRAARSRHGADEPRIAKHNVKTAQKLFFALRCTIVRDPGHLPDGLLEVTLDTGQTDYAKSRDEVEQHRGTPFEFDEIWAHQLSRMKTERNGEEIYSHRYTTPTNNFVEAHRRNLTKDSRAVLDQAWGTIAWRLQQ